MVVGQPELAVGFGGGDEQSGLVVLAAVDVEERRGGLEVGAGEAGVGVGAVLLWWASAVAALAQISRSGTEGRTYYERCLGRGKTKREAIRALKRRISDRVWTHLQHTNPTPRLT